jgi:regulatory protein
MPKGHGQKPSPQHVAMNLLARREHSRAELKTKLLAREFNETEVDDAIADLATRDLVSDERFAEAFTNSRVRRGQGPVRIRQELRQRGVEAAVIHRCLDTLAPDWADVAGATRLKKFGAAPPADYKEKARQMRFLQYRGFTTEQINSAFDTVVAGDEIDG